MVFFNALPVLSKVNKFALSLKSHSKESKFCQPPEKAAPIAKPNESKRIKINLKRQLKSKDIFRFPN